MRCEDQAGLCSFDCLEMWRNQLFQALMKQPPAGHKYVTIQQSLNADKEMWSVLSQDTRGALRVVAGADPPLDEHVKKLRSSPQILYFMTPLLADTLHFYIKQNQPNVGKLWVNPTLIASSALPMIWLMGSVQ